jgi:hypothetical protein
MVGQPTQVGVRRNLINVRRNHVFEDGIAKMSRAKFEPSRPLSVKFADELGSSEGAVDLGGPTREFLRLAVREAFSSNAFGGTSASKVIVLNQEGRDGGLVSTLQSYSGISHAAIRAQPFRTLLPIFYCSCKAIVCNKVLWSTITITLIQTLILTPNLWS